MYYQIVGTNTRLLGSLHLFPAEFPELPTWASDAYTWCEDVIFECDAATIADHRLLPHGVSLEDCLPPDLWADFSPNWPVLEPPLEQLKPWAAMLQFGTLLNPCVSGCEGIIKAACSADGKPCYFLETATDLTRALESVSDSVYSDGIQTIYDNLEMIRQSFGEIHRAWYAGDLEAVGQIAKRTPIGAIPALQNALVAQRNRDWMPKILDILKGERRSLIGIGALHLCGKDSVISLLQGYGLNVSRLL